MIRAHHVAALLTTFAITAVPQAARAQAKLDILFVIDNSGSMGSPCSARSTATT